MPATHRQLPERGRSARQPRPQRARASSDQRPGLRARTGLTLAAAGAILLFAVHGHLAFIDLQAAGLVLMVAGLTWLWIPVRGKRELLQRSCARAVGYLTWDPRPTGSARCSLTELLGSGEPEQ